MEVREGFPEEVSAEGPASNSGHRATELGAGAVIDRPDGFPYCVLRAVVAWKGLQQGMWLLQQGTLISQLPAPLSQMGTLRLKDAVDLGPCGLICPTAAYNLEWTEG